jgi:hypothetical protein
MSRHLAKFRGLLLPRDGDFSSVRIYQSFAAGSLGTLVKTVSGAPGVAATTDITSLPLGPVYFTLRPVDASANENPDTAQLTVIITGP